MRMQPERYCDQRVLHQVIRIQRQDYSSWLARKGLVSSGDSLTRLRVVSAARRRAGWADFPVNFEIAVKRLNRSVRSSSIA